MNIALVYIYPVPGVGLSPYEQIGQHEQDAIRFVSTVGAFPPGVEHRKIFVSNGGPPTTFMRCLASCLGPVEWFEHDDTGWDIGAYIAVSKAIDCDLMFCMGGSSYVLKEGWLRRIKEAWEKYGYGMYGTLATYEIMPHFCSTGFGVPPEELRHYPYPVVSREDRYRFEHGGRSLVIQIMRKDIPAVLVTWTGEYLCPDWRKPQNIYAKGDQSNCLTYFRHSDSYMNSSPTEQQRRTHIAGSFSDQESRCLCMRNLLVKKPVLA